MNDIEIILRCFAMLENSSEYKPPMSKFINSYSRKAIKYDAIKISYFEKLFSDFVNSCISIDPSQFFTKGKKFNISIFESVFYASCKSALHANNYSLKIITYQKIETIKQNEEFNNAVTSRTTGSTNVRTRLRIAEENI